MLDGTFGSWTRSRVRVNPLPSLGDRFGIRSTAAVVRDLAEVVRDGLAGTRFQVDVGSAGLLRPDLSLAAYAGMMPSDGRAPVFNLFDRVGGGRRYTQRVSRKSARDFRGGKLSYDEHDGTDLVCPVGTPLVAAAPGRVVMIRDRFLRGGLTVAVDHGSGIVTQYTHCSRATAPLGAVVRRGDPVAVSGAAGLDMVQFFPWVPPHIHFMVYVDGRPVDPFLAEGESRRPGTWADPSDPAPSSRRSGDEEAPAPSLVDEEALALAARTCRDGRIRAEIQACNGVRERVAALLEDALAHDAWAWPSDIRIASVRPQKDAREEARARSIALTLPLPKAAYVGVRFADAPWTAPSRGAQ